MMFRVTIEYESDNESKFRVMHASQELWAALADALVATTHGRLEHVLAEAVVSIMERESASTEFWDGRNKALDAFCDAARTIAEGWDATDTKYKGAVT